MNSNYERETIPVNISIHTNEYGGKYYILNGIKYHISFPLSYALSHKRGTGPEDCGNCAHFGSISSNKVFLGYCSNCSVSYDYERGIGLDENGKESQGKDIVIHVYKYGFDSVFTPFSEEEIKRNSIYNTYLKDTTREELLKQFPTADVSENYEVKHETFPQHLPQCCQEFLLDPLVNVIDDDEYDSYSPTRAWTPTHNGTMSWKPTSGFNINPNKVELNDWNDDTNEVLSVTPNQNSTESILAMARGLLECKAMGLFNPIAQKRDLDFSGSDLDDSILDLDPEPAEEVDEESHNFDAIEEAIQKGHIGLR